jgi:spore coat polysaccharide biosynthesis protein SpsF (cytidylyltransferase family)
MRVLAIIQARLGSTRLPRKALMDIGGKPLIQHVAERVAIVAEFETVVVAVPSAADADAIRPHVDHVAMVFHASSIAEPDVLGRYVACLNHFGCDEDIIVRITGDCPLWNPDEGRRVLLEYLRQRPSVEYVTNAMDGYYVDGEDVEVFSADALRAANIYATDPHDREHVGPFMARTYPALICLPTGARVAHPKTSVDTLEDLERVRAMVVGPPPPPSNAYVRKGLG